MKRCSLVMFLSHVTPHFAPIKHYNHISSTSSPHFLKLFVPLIARPSHLPHTNPTSSHTLPNKTHFKAVETSADHLTQLQVRTLSMLSVRIQVDGDIADSLAESLMCFGASSCSVEEDAADMSNEQEMMSTGPSPWEDQYRQLWKKSCVTALFSPEVDVGESIAWAVDSIGLRDIPAYKIEEAEDQDWIKNVQDLFRPIEVASGLWIVPR